MLDAFEQSNRQADLERHRRQEYDALVSGLGQRVREGSLPPDDAYAWTRILVRQAEGIGVLVKGWRCE